ncbi:unnamed protein product [Rhizoctonia solani]|uniref:Uncharacterized protein n=1 Tax=Rhizoctonia solani TaxID=456999 RepID=A0A8H3AIT3_9AGAM|nr:unnamed protein product [Rhizoctonia solani]
MDIAFSITTGLPTNIKYDTSGCPEIANSMPMLDDKSHLGMSWLNGLPDELFVILAHINALSENYGPRVDIETIRSIEGKLQELNRNLQEPSVSLVARSKLDVQRSWCQVAYIYLYLSVCGADALDARIMRAQQEIMKIVNTSNPSLILDTHLGTCILFAGIVTSKHNERLTILTRLINLPESAFPGSYFHTAIRSLQDVWVRADTENRPAEWNDYRLAVIRIVNVG